MISLCQLNELGLSCFGCCGRNFWKKEWIKESIDKNTEEYKNSNSLTEFRDRFYRQDIRSTGICPHVIWTSKGRFGCALHPKFTGSDEDLRQNHCNPQYLCKTMRYFLSWDEATKKRYIDFIRSKSLDWYDYSILTDNNKLLEEFLSMEKGREIKFEKEEFEWIK